MQIKKEKRLLISTAKTNAPCARHFEIRYDTKAGFYMFAYEHDRVIYDDLQDTVEFAKKSAFDQFQVPLNAWQDVS